MRAFIRDDNGEFWKIWNKIYWVSESKHFAVVTTVQNAKWRIDARLPCVHKNSTLFIDECVQMFVHMCTVVKGEIHIWLTYITVLLVQQSLLMTMSEIGLLRIFRHISDCSLQAFGPEGFDIKWCIPNNSIDILQATKECYHGQQTEITAHLLLFLVTRSAPSFVCFPRNLV